jgi:hypothetical protein
MNEYMALENDYSDLLSPERVDRNVSIIGQLDQDLEREDRPTDGELLRELVRKTDKILAIIAARASQGEPSSLSTAADDSQTQETDQPCQAEPPPKSNRGRPKKARNLALVHRIPSTKTLDELMHVWEHGNTDLGIEPLKNWGREQRCSSDTMRSQYSKRKAIVDFVNSEGREELERLVGTEPTITDMYKAVSKRRTIRGSVRTGEEQ